MSPTPLRRLAAPCGHYCSDCEPLRSGACCGCAYGLGQTPHGECAVFCCCVLERGLEHCGTCLDFPCQIFMGHAAPLVVGRRYRALTRRAEVGTDAWLDEQAGRK